MDSRKKIYVVTHGELMSYEHIAYFEDEDDALGVWRHITKASAHEIDNLENLNPMDDEDVYYPYYIFCADVNERGALHLVDIGGDELPVNIRR